MNSEFISKHGKKLSSEVLMSNIIPFAGSGLLGCNGFCFEKNLEVDANYRMLLAYSLSDGIDIYDRNIDPVIIKRRIGMVFQKPNPFPTMSIHDNVAAGLKLNGIRDKRLIDEIVRES